MSYESDVVSATSGRGEPDWDKIIKLCNRIRDSVGTVSMAQAMASVMRRVKHTDSNIQLHALTLLESCVSNCGQDFQMELTKSTFHTDVKGILAGPYTGPKVKQRVKELLASWMTEFKSNSKMSPFIKFVQELKIVQATPTSRPVQQSQPASSAPAGEDVDLKKAIELSLLESKNTSPPTGVSLYPSFGSTPSQASQQKQPQKKAKKVRAVYDFVAAEDNELSFRAGEIITLLDDNDENWWRGETQLGRGLFPASFVSANLSVEPQPSSVEKNEGTQASVVQKTKKSKKAATKKVAINEEKIDLFLDMIKGADVTSEDNKAENETLVELEGECKKMKPLVEESIKTLQSQEDEMLEINKNFDDALSLYRKMLSEGPRLSSAVPQKQPIQQEPVQYNGPPPQQAVGYMPSLPQSTQPASFTPPQPRSSHLASYTAPQPSSYTPPLPRSSPATGYSSPLQQPYSLEVKHSYPSPLQQPPPYTADSVSTGSMYNGQLEQPTGLYGESMLGQTSMNTVGTTGGQQAFQAPQSFYGQPPSQPVGLPSQIRSGMSPSPGPPSQPTSYQPAFYPQQQPLL